MPTLRPIPKAKANLYLSAWEHGRILGLEPEDSLNGERITWDPIAWAC